MRRLLDRLGAPEWAGLALLIGWVVWAVVAAGLAGQILAPTSPYVVAPVSLGIGVATGGLVTRRVDTMTIAIGLLGLAGLLLIGVLLTPGPGRGPLVYPNANAALAVQVIGLSGLAMVRTGRGERIVAAIAALVSLAVVAANGSTAGLGVALPLLAIVAMTARHPARRRGWAALFAVVCAAVIAAAATGIVTLARRDAWPSGANLAFDSVRRSLWRDAAALWSDHQVTGAGPGAFQIFNPLGHDPDTAAAHSSVLQIGAETGTVGVVLFGLIVLAGLAWAARGTSAAYGIIGAATWTALLVHSFVDHLVDFPPIVLAAGVVLGWAGSPPRGSEELDVPERESPV